MSKKAFLSLLVAFLIAWFMPLSASAAEDSYSNTGSTNCQANVANAQVAVTPAHQAAFASSPETLYTLAQRIGVANIRSGLLPGVVIGGHHEGILKIVQQRYTASGVLDERLESAARQAIEDELVAAGYNVALSEPHSVFGEQLLEDPEPARFLVGGTITEVSLNSYSFLNSSKTEDQRKIRWEVLDRDTSKVIARYETTGQATTVGVENPAATYEAIRDSFKALLHQPDFTDKLQQAASAQPALPTSSAKYKIAAIASGNEPLTVEQVARHTIPSVAWIHTPMARGSGFFIDSSGLLLTNQHVVGSAFTVKVDLYDGSTKTGRVLKRNAAHDVALVKVDMDPATVPGLPLCDINALRVGQEVVAIGNPLGLSNTVTKGIISGIRTVDHRSLIQTDVAINPGNSGGPLLNQQGSVIGIVTEKIASTGVEGLGFALPIGESLRKLDIEVAPGTTALNNCGTVAIASRI